MSEPLPLPDLSLNLVEDTADAADFLDWLNARTRPVAVDTETKGLDWWRPDFTRLVQFGDTAGGWALDARQWRGPITEALDHLRVSDTPVVFHNAKFDMHALESDGFPVPAWRNVHDTAVQHHLLDNLSRHGLKAIAGGLYGPKATFGERVLKDEMRLNKWTWATVPTDCPALWQYGVLDTCLTALLHSRPEFRKVREHPVYEREMAAMAVYYRAERRGMTVDVARAQLLRDQWSQEAAALHGTLSAAGIENPNSNAQITQVLKAAGWLPDLFTPTGEAQLDKKVLRALEATYPGVATPLLRYKQLTKWIATYLDPFADSGGTVHPSIHLLGARTGRMSVSTPPLQQLPRDANIRSCVVPHADDERLYAADYDGQELRLMAHYSEDPALLRTFTEDLDPHTFAASLCYSKEMPEVTKAERSMAKNTVYARLYGGGPAKIAETAGVSESEIRQFLNVYAQEFPYVDQFISTVERTGAQRLSDEGTAYVRSHAGRKVATEPDGLYRLVNYLIQGSAKDVLTRCTIDLDLAGLSDYIVVPVHDEILFSLPEAEGPALVKEIADVMTDRTSFRVPLTVGADGPLQNWGEKYE